MWETNSHWQPNTPKYCRPPYTIFTTYYWDPNGTPTFGKPPTVLQTGMDEMEFTEAESNMNDLVSEYQQYQAVRVLGLGIL